MNNTNQQYEKSLFSDDDAGYGPYSEDGMALYKKAEAALVPLFQEYVDLGYNTREMQQLIINLASTIDRIYRAMKDHE